ncbi:MAG: phosphate-selective porin OprO/OprP [Arenicella sp.]|jgi:phosphate-selective porin OprO/OprP
MLIRNLVMLCALLLLPHILLAGVVTTDGDDLVVSINGPIEIKTSDGNYSAKLGGRIQWDYNYAELNGVADEDDFSIRRARLYLSGHVNDWSYKVQFNVGNGNGGTHEDLYIRYNGWGKQAVVTVGNQNEPFGLEQLESSKDISYLERSAVTEAYVPGRQEGMLFSGQRGDITYALGVFEDDGASDGTAVTGRVTYAPIKSADHVLHFGVAHSNRDEDIDITGLEVAYAKGPYHIQSEFISSEENDASREGLYVQAGWIITGETRPYKNGIFKRVKPGNSSGAWEVVVRYEDGDGAYSDEELGSTDATSYGIGLNYYLNKFIRIGATFTDAKDNINGDDGSEFRTRLQIAL